MGSDATLAAAFFASVDARGDAPALKSKRGQAWEATSWTDWAKRVALVADELTARGVGPGDRVAIFGNTREEWVTTDVATMACGAVTVPIYQTLIGEQAAYILEDSGAKVLACDDGSFVQRVLEAAPARVAALDAIVVFDESRLSGLPAHVRAKIVAWKSVMKKADPQMDRARASAAVVRPSDLATIIYTSGTTGPPKGVCLTHGEFVFESNALSTLLGITYEDEHLLFLPMAHVFAKICVVGHILVGSTLTFAESLMKALDNAAETSPTWMACVPRLYEKIYQVASEKAEQQGTVKYKVFQWATGIGREAARIEGRGGRLEGMLKVERHYADKLVLKQIRERFGKKLRFAISGGAPLSPDLGEWFAGAGVKILEGYGLTETTAAATINRPGTARYGSVGQALPGVEVRIAPDGEVLIRGPNVMSGYWKREAETREAIDADGWFHSGDIGALDGEGRLTITDRKKDILVTAGGKNVAPQNIENLLRQSPWIAQAVVLGDRRPYVVALLTLDLDAMRRFARETGRKADLESLSRDHEVRARIDLEVQAANRRLSQFETVKKFAILPVELTVEGGELTPTLKVKRKLVLERFKEEIDALYGPAAPSA